MGLVVNGGNRAEKAAEKADECAHGKLSDLLLSPSAIQGPTKCISCVCCSCCVRRQSDGNVAGFLGLF